jgi:hypothetical protein
LQNTILGEHFSAINIRENRKGVIQNGKSRDTSNTGHNAQNEDKQSNNKQTNKKQTKQTKYNKQHGPTKKPEMSPSDPMAMCHKVI